MLRGEDASMSRSVVEALVSHDLVKGTKRCLFVWSRPTYCRLLFTQDDTKRVVRVETSDEGVHCYRLLYLSTLHVHILDQTARNGSTHSSGRPNYSISDAILVTPNIFRSNGPGGNSRQSR